MKKRIQKLYPLNRLNLECGDIILQRVQGEERCLFLMSVTKKKYEIFYYTRDETGKEYWPGSYRETEILIFKDFKNNKIVEHNSKDKLLMHTLIKPDNER